MRLGKKEDSLILFYIIGIGVEIILLRIVLGSITTIFVFESNKSFFYSDWLEQKRARELGGFVGIKRNFSDEMKKVVSFVFF